MYRPYSFINGQVKQGSLGSVGVTFPVWLLRGSSATLMSRMYYS